MNKSHTDLKRTRAGEMRRPFNFSGPIRTLPEFHRGLMHIKMTKRVIHPPSLDELVTHPKDEHGMVDLASYCESAIYSDVPRGFGEFRIRAEFSAQNYTNGSAATGIAHTQRVFLLIHLLTTIFCFFSFPGQILTLMKKRNTDKNTTQTRANTATAITGKGSKLTHFIYQLPIRSLDTLILSIEYLMKVISTISSFFYF